MRLSVFALLLLAGCSCGDDDDDLGGDGDADADGDADGGGDADGDGDADGGADASVDAGTDASVDPCCPEGGTCCRAADLGYPADLCVAEGAVCPAPCDLCAEGQWCQEPVAGLPVVCSDACPDPQQAPEGRCCPIGSHFVEGVGCPLPDLTIDPDYLATHIVFDRETFAPEACEVFEGCVPPEAGDRRLLRFGLRTPNVGTGNLHFGDPTFNPLFQYSECHMHNHFNGYARYQLVDANGAEVGTGHKQAFCLLDYEPVDPADPWTPVYGCDYQGIQSGWVDIYESRLPCQWIDITGVAPGEYFIRATVNPDGIIVESSMDNNVVSVPVTLEDPAVNSCPNGCPPLDGGCCIDGDPCGYAEDGYCDCLGQSTWDTVDCAACTTDDPECPA